MPKQNRNTLKSFFSDGAMPTSDMFEDFIDSTLNINDDGFEKNEIDGLKLSNSGDYKSFMSVYDQQDRDKEEWVFKLDGLANNLVIGHPEAENKDKPETNEEVDRKNQLNYAVCLTKENSGLRVGIGTRTPKGMLDVNGAVHAQGRRGSFGESFNSIKANGQWHTITAPIRGGIALEVTARAINREKKYYGMMHAIALHSPWAAKRDLGFLLGLKNKIRYTHGFYDSMLHKLKLRWKRLPGEDLYCLQLRSNCNYGEEGVLDFHITCLWSDDDIFNKPDNPTDDSQAVT